jgi:hypothetical protein
VKSRNRVQSDRREHDGCGSETPEHELLKVSGPDEPPPSRGATAVSEATAAPPARTLDS